MFSDDHGTPHVHARFQGKAPPDGDDTDGWTASVGFSFLTDDLRLLSLRPAGTAPSLTVLQDLLDDMREHVVTCRGLWWTMQSNTGLEGRWLQTLSGGAREISTQWRYGAARVDMTIYDPATGSLVLLTEDGVRVNIDADMRQPAGGRSA
jgi:hypothetical protein